MNNKTIFSHLLLILTLTMTFNTAPTFAAKAKSKPKACTEESCPKLTSVTIIDRNGFSETVTNKDRIKQYEGVNFLNSQPYKKVIRVYERDQKAEIHSYLHTYYENGQPQQYLEVVSGRAFGNYTEWHQNGTKKLSGTVIGGVADLTPPAQQTWVFDGTCKAWDENGALSAEIPYAKGVMEGFSLYYHSNGQIWKKVPNHDNKIDGTFETFLENGELLQKATYTQGNRQGTLVRYWEPKKLAAEEEWLRDNLVSGRYYDTQGKLISQVEQGSGFRAIFGKTTVSELQEYKQGVQEGVVKVLTKSGQLSKIYRIKDEQKNGEEIEYYSGKDNRPKFAVNWSEGSMHGIVRTWYENGNLESQRDHNNNKKQGLSTAWYRDGSLMLIEEYDQDKLVKGEYYKKGVKVPCSTITNGKGTVTLFDAEGNFIKKVTYQNGKPNI
jgi:antitoxin component YwqK of YwqJK toxin-antitoxin module